MKQVDCHSGSGNAGPAEIGRSVIPDDRSGQSRKMEALARLAAGVAHDFNNLLTIIGGYSDVLLGLEGFHVDGRRSAQEIKRATERACVLTRQLCDFSRKEPAQPKLVNLGDLVRGLMPLLTRTLGDDIALAAVVSTEVPSVMADPVQLEWTFLNLAANARDAMPRGGRVDIEVQTIALETGTVVRVIVRDTGCGMDVATQAHIFEPFFVTKRPGRSTGLGLSIVYSAVMQSGGSIRVVSEVGEGTAFSMDFPAVNASDRPASKSDRRQVEPSETETILVVDQDPAFRALLQSTLLLKGYRVLEAKDGFEAIRIGGCYPGSIHALLTDAHLTDVNVRAVAAAFRLMRPDGVVLYMSGHADEILDQQGLPSHRRTILRKPCTPAILLQELWAALNCVGRRSEMSGPDRDAFQTVWGHARVSRAGGRSR